MLSIFSVFGSAFFGATTLPVIAYAQTPITALEAPYVETVKSTLVEPTTPLTIKEKIIKKAEEYHYSTSTALAIAVAESHLNPKVKNASSTASGLYQFLDGTFFTYCIKKYKFATSTLQKNDTDVQIECAVKMLSEGGEKHWIESSLDKKGWYN